MPKSIPIQGETPWGNKLNDHLAQLSDPTKGGFNLWFGEDQRPWPNGDTSHDDYDNFTGYNTAVGLFERWQSTDRKWIVMQQIEVTQEVDPNLNPFIVDGVGQVELFAQNNLDLQRFLYLSLDSGNLSNQVSEHDVIEIDDGGTFKYFFVERIRSANIVQVRSVEEVYDDIDPDGDIRIETFGNTIPNKIVVVDNLNGDPAPANYFNIGDKFRIPNSSGVIMEQIGGSDFEYRMQFFTAFNIPVDVLDVFRAPTGLNNFKVFKPSIKYIDIEERVQFSTDQYGITRLGKIERNVQDLTSADSANDLVVRQFYKTYDGNSASQFLTQDKKDYAIRTTIDSAKYEHLAGTNLDFYRRNAQEFFPPGTASMSNWNGSFDGDVSNLYVRSGHGQNMKDGTGEAVTPILMNIRTDGEVRSGKIEKFYHLYMDFVNVFTDGTSPDEIWGLVEKGSANGRPSKNYFSGNTKFGGSSDYSVITEKLEVDGNITATGTITPNSDKRLKTNIKTIESPLEKIKELEGVTFDWKDPQQHGDGGNQVGLLAQDVEKVLPQAVKTKEDSIGTKSVNYNGLTGLLVECIKQQQKKIEELEKKLNKL